MKPHAGHAHEAAYLRMRESGVQSWGERQGIPGAPPREIDPDTLRFLEDALAQPWAPTSGRILELGCGTAPLLRFLVGRAPEDFTGMGIDLAPTALEMAREQSADLPLEFLETDLCLPLPNDLGEFQLILDGHCLHCVPDPAHRAVFLANVRNILAPGGIFLVTTMCGPIRRGHFHSLFPEQAIERGVVYVPSEDASDYPDSRKIGGRTCLASRAVFHWRALLQELRAASFEILAHRYHAACEASCVGNLAVACRGRSAGKPIPKARG